MDYSESLEYLNHLEGTSGIKLGLETMQVLLDGIGNPQNKLRFIHVAGTNGKGSLASYINQVLLKAGYSVGIYSSPHLVSTTERVRMNERDISEEDFSRILNYIKECTDSMISKGYIQPTAYEVLTSLAFAYFHEKKCDFVILEVGLGGRYDATNVINQSEVAVITKISLDHQDFLGDTLEKIAYEKAGIIKNKSNVVIYPQALEVEAVINSVARSHGAVVRKPDFNNVQLLESSIEGQTFKYYDTNRITIHMLGMHQVYNATVAIEVFSVLASLGYSISQQNIVDGLQQTYWPGRFEVLQKNPYFIIDGAHNPDGVQSFVAALRSSFPNRKMVFIIGILKDKDFKKMISTLIPLAQQFITVTIPDNDRALCGTVLASEIHKQGFQNVIYKEDIKEALEAMNDDKNSIYCGIGSLALIGFIYKYYKNMKG